MDDSSRYPNARMLPRTVPGSNSMIGQMKFHRKPSRRFSAFCARAAPPPLPPPPLPPPPPRARAGGTDRIACTHITATRVAARAQIVSNMKTLILMMLLRDASGDTGCTDCGVTSNPDPLSGLTGLCSAGMVCCRLTLSGNVYYECKHPNGCPSFQAAGAPASDICPAGPGNSCTDCGGVACPDGQKCCGMPQSCQVAANVFADGCQADIAITCPDAPAEPGAPPLPPTDPPPPPIEPPMGPPPPAPWPPGEGCAFWCSYATCHEYQCSGCHSICHPDHLSQLPAGCAFWCNSWTVRARPRSACRAPPALLRAQRIASRSPRRSLPFSSHAARAHTSPSALGRHECTCRYVVVHAARAWYVHARAVRRALGPLLRRVVPRPVRHVPGVRLSRGRAWSMRRCGGERYASVEGRLPLCVECGACGCGRVLWVRRAGACDAAQALALAFAPTGCVSHASPQA